MNRTRNILALMMIIAIGFYPACRPGNAPSETGLADEDRQNAPTGTVTLSAEAQADGGIVVAQAKRTVLAGKISAPGELDFDARRLVEVSARADGRIERVAAVAGDRVSSGQVLAEIYSREYLASQTEVLQAVSRAARLRGDPEESAANAFLQAARRKLHPLGLEDTDIDALIAAGEVRPFLSVRAPFSGTIIEAPALAGAHVDMGGSLFKLADMSSLWACVHIFEKDLSGIRAGSDTILRTQAYPDREFMGRLVLIGAVMDEKTRTVKGRVEVGNIDGSLRAGMYVEAAISSGAERSALVVPAAALQEFQSRPIVFVKTGATTFVLRPVETGARTAAEIEITNGLSAGESVVTAGSFLIKSELLKSSLGD
ncbi:MAG: efflux RND transporter periplasmic adaptor subunit [Candidatus Aminicenantes bacterium]|nr:efflux RND transporter periplasmic adaptor subunit [Candidatus Aminicenantes bacterium]